MLAQADAFLRWNSTVCRVNVVQSFGCESMACWSTPSATAAVLPKVAEAEGSALLHRADGGQVTEAGEQAVSRVAAEEGQRHHNQI